MSENNKTVEFVQKLAPCIERSDLDACVEEAARVAGEMGIGAEELLVLSAQAGMTGVHALVYVLALATVHGLEEEDKAVAYSNAGFAAQNLIKNVNAEKYYNKAIEANPKLEDEKALDESASPFYKKFVKPIVVAIVTIILGYITNLFSEWKTHATIWNFIKSTIFSQTLP